MYKYTKNSLNCFLFVAGASLAFTQTAMQFQQHDGICKYLQINMHSSFSLKHKVRSHHCGSEVELGIDVHVQWQTFFQGSL